jgi:hypothetical protein
MTIAQSNNRQRTPPQAGLSNGLDVGGMRVEGHGRDTLLLRSGQTFERLLLVVGVAFLILGAVRLAAPGKLGGPRAEGNVIRDWGFVLLCFGVVGTGIGVNEFRRSWSFDGRARTATRVRGFKTRTWAAPDLLGVSLRVRHLGPREILTVALETSTGSEDVTFALADGRGLALPAAAARIAELLDVPLTRSGVPVQGGAEMRSALDTVAPPPQGPQALGDGRDLVIKCPACKRQQVPGVSYEHHEQSHGFTRTTTWVKCLACGTSLYSKVPPDQLVGRSPEQLAEVVVFRLSLIARATAILAVCVCLLPYVGTGMALLATLITWRTRGWPRPLSRIALAISVVPTVALIILLRTPAK